MKNPWDVVSGFKHDNGLKCHWGKVSQWTFQVGLNVTVDETWVDVTSRHHQHQDVEDKCAVDVENENQNCFTWRRSSTLFVVNIGHILALPRLKSSDSTYMFGIYSKIVIVSL
jgi:hypothetical protein